LSNHQDFNQQKKQQMAPGIRSPGRKTMKPTQAGKAIRRPRRRAESSSLSFGLKARRASLEQQALRLIALLGRKRLELGQTLNQLRDTCNHGEWENYYRKTFGDSFSFRTAGRYMKLAAEAADKAKSDSLSILKPGTDQHAVNIRKATERARAETGVSTEQKPEQVYRLALHLSTAQRNATILLWQSPDRPRAEREVVAVLERCLIESGLISSDSLKSKKREAKSA
jgi:hypothetical protein